jgi:endopeptidase Clp ATP-binding regulatory subunit ClpX
MADTNAPEERRLDEQLREMMRHVGIAGFGPVSVPKPAADGDGAQNRREARLKQVQSFALKPRDIAAYLDRFVIGQTDAQQALAVAVCDHYNHVRRCLEDAQTRDREYAKPNILLLGPTGVGKTYLIRCLARLIGVPFVKADATKFSETGYVGRDADDLVRDLVKAADGDTALAEYGIIYLDEVDKIAAQASSSGRDVSGRGVQVNMLKLMEETEVSPYSQTDLVGQVQAVLDMQRGREGGQRPINTRHILFIASGAFATLAEAVERRLYAGRIGFDAAARADRRSSDVLRRATTQDYIQYGFEPEFVGRLPIRVVCDPLSVEDLERILRQSEGSVLAQYAADFRGYGMEARFDDGAIREAAARAYDEGTGARGLLTVLERTLRPFKYELPSTAVRILEVTGDTVRDPEGELKRLLADPDRGAKLENMAALDGFARDFEQRHGIALSFSEKARAAFVEMCRRGGVSGAEYCRTRFRDFEHGYNLVARRTGKKVFRVSAGMVENPDGELPRLVAKSFAGNAAE